MNIKSENSSNSKIIYDITPFTHLDYPGYLAATLWFCGCNMRCDYCYNPEIVFAKEGKYGFDDVVSFLQTRTSLLDGVVLCGGEATLYNLIPLCTKLKEMGFSVKLDTNGSHPKQIQELLKRKLIDFVALDYKAPKAKYQSITHANHYEAMSQTLNILLKEQIAFEVRTTLHTQLLGEDDINTIIEDLFQRGYSYNYYIQKFLDTSESIKPLPSPSFEFDTKRLSNKLKVVFR